MPNAKIRLSDKFNKEVLVGSEEEALFIRSLDTHNKLRDREAGVNPAGATHDVVKDKEGNYRVQRGRFSAI